MPDNASDRSSPPHSAAPRPPAGEGPAQANSGQREAKQAQLTPETGTGTPVSPGKRAEVPPDPHPAPPDPPQPQEPEADPVPPTANKHLPDAKYGKGDIQEPPPAAEKLGGG